MASKSPAKYRLKTHNPKPKLLQQIKRIVLAVIVILVSLSIVSCLVLRWLPLPTSMFMIYRHVEDLRYDQRFESIEYQWVSADKISKQAFIAVMASEDQRFFEHFGFDLNEISNAVELYMDGGSLRGASTLSQQVAKNVFLTPSRSFLRKGLEVWFTLLIELLWSKERILEVYLNIAEFGDHLFGIEAASRRYFGASAKQITAQQAALLAATLPNPIVLRAMQPSSYVLRRQHWILKQMPHITYPRA